MISNPGPLKYCLVLEYTKFSLSYQVLEMSVFIKGISGSDFSLMSADCLIIPLSWCKELKRGDYRPSYQGEWLLSDFNLESYLDMIF